MIEKKVSSTIILDKDDNVVGIVTERDILRKLSTLDIDRKLDKKINTIMSRSLKCARADHIRTDIENLAANGFRHFPISRSIPPVKSSIVGIITVTDIARAYLSKEDTI